MTDLDVPEVVRLAAALDASNRANLKAQQEVVDLKRKLAAAPQCWECPDCAFSFDAVHVTQETGGYDCPNCAETAAIARAEAAEARERALRDAAADFIRQVDEFQSWDELDWPAALGALNSFREQFRAALSETKGPA